MFTAIEKEVVYKAFDLSIISEIPLPELPYKNNETGSEDFDIEIKIEDLSGLWSQLSDHKEIVVKENLVMFQAPNIATFSIHEGKKIIVSPLEEYDEAMVRLWILGSCMGALLMQRRILPLHGSAVAINGKAYAIIGDSGAGKSTLASGFLQQGYHLLSDDVIAITFEHDTGIPSVIPSYPQQKLWQDSLNNFGMDSSDYRSIFGRENKYTVPVSTKYHDKSLPLAGVFELVKIDRKEIEINRIDNLRRFYTLFNHTFRNFFIQGLGLMDWHFQTSTKIINNIDIYQLRRPVSGFNAPQLVSTILSTISKGE